MRFNFMKNEHLFDWIEVLPGLGYLLLSLLLSRPVLLTVNKIIRDQQQPQQVEQVQEEDIPKLQIFKYETK